ncbi:glycoside hydrolase N-terminal domain-containing protein [Kutzneria buriramensis]|uniref:Alpha-L-fucosidase 2 n=1 Tax=Kutzneria buriramensis TaxID=1045776 RepID=A0A3E0GTS0_9PSEU|nr:glycoside hydrolase N-terminal domain-containing protein [Kutzneria buriramensis]REH27082.1 alpha-L-fucosidase 2 [Kutzneria buriramensis]
MTESAGHTRRDAFRLGGALGVAAAITGLRPFAAQADPVRPADAAVVPDGSATVLWYPAPADEGRIIEQGLPVGNGRLGGLVGGDPGSDFVYVTDITLWTGDVNDEIQDDGQFRYDNVHFGSYGQLARVGVDVPAHALAGVQNYQRRLDLSNGVVAASYTYKGVHYRREVYSSHPDDVLVIRLTQSGGGSYTGSVSLAGTHGETTTGGSDISFAGTLGNGLKYATVVTAKSKGGSVSVQGNKVAFAGCGEVLIVVCGGTNYAATPATAFKDAAVDPLAVARQKAAKAVGVAGDTLLTTHVADYQALYNRMTVDLGRSSAKQRSKDTWGRLWDRAAPHADPDPELEASYLQFGRYLVICGSRDSLPLNLQGLWVSNNNPDWYSDYHTDINVQMNYWLPDRAGLSKCFDAFADYCVSQLSSWTATTQKGFNDSRNRFRNSSGKIAGWAVAFSTNPYGGSGWWWHPSGNAWLCNNLWQHYEFAPDKAYLTKIYPLLKGAVRFWEARLIERDGKLYDDHDWSPEHGPQDGIGNTYSQELVWDLFTHYRTATDVLGQDQDYGRAITAMRDRLYLPVVSPKSGWLEEWMSPDNLGETTHRHLSPLIGFFPGDRIRVDTSPKELVDGVRNLLTARGFRSFGWGCAWRSACWAHLRDGENAYRMLLAVLTPSVNFGNGSAANLFDMYSFGDRTIFQIDANFGAPTAMLEMIVQSKPGLIDLLPALPAAWAPGGSVTGVGVRAGFTVDLEWRNGKVTSLTLHSTGGTTAVIRTPAGQRTVTIPANTSQKVV